MHGNMDNELDVSGTEQFSMASTPMAFVRTARTQFSP